MCSQYVLQVNVDDVNTPSVKTVLARENSEMSLKITLACAIVSATVNFYCVRCLSSRRVYLGFCNQGWLIAVQADVALSIRES
jgi:hypothetical protein